MNKTLATATIFKCLIVVLLLFILYNIYKNPTKETFYQKQCTSEGCIKLQSEKMFYYKSGDNYHGPFLYTSVRKSCL